MIEKTFETAAGKDSKVIAHPINNPRKLRGVHGGNVSRIFHFNGFFLPLGYVACGVFLFFAVNGCEWDDMAFDGDSVRSSYDPDVVVFEDEGLERAVRMATGATEGELNPDECASLAELDASNFDIESLSGIEVLSSLERLNLSWNRLRGVEELRSLPRLKQLDISWNNVEDLGPLADLQHLDMLDVSWNDIDDLSRLAGSTRLSCFVGNGNAVRNPGGLEDVSSLEALELEDNPLEGDLHELLGGRELDYLEVLALPPIEDIGKRLRAYSGQLAAPASSVGVSRPSGPR